MPAFPEEPNPLAETCERCPALVDCRERIAWGTGPTDADLVVVGEAPAAGDPEADRWRGGNWTGMAYTSAHSGRRIRDLLADAGHPDAYYTNAVKCFPCAGEENREPTPEELANCRPYLREELEQVDPVAVVPTGKHATRSVLAMADRDLDGFLDTVLSPLELDGLPPVVPLLHPSYADVWRARLGYDREGYVDSLRETLAAVGE